MHQCIMHQCISPTACVCQSPGTADASTCDATTGQCLCQINVGGIQCDQCKDGFYNMTSTGCSSKFLCFSVEHSIDIYLRIRYLFSAINNLSPTVDDLYCSILGSSSSSFIFKTSIFPRSARVRRSSRNEAPPHIPEHCPFRVQTRRLHIILHTFIPSLPPSTHTSHPCPLTPNHHPHLPRLTTSSTLTVILN